MVKADLIQPRHNYAPLFSKETLGHVYMPTSLLTAGARLLDRGIDIELHDENIRPRQLSSEYVGINLLGAPYIPEAIRMQREIDEGVQRGVTYLLGGQVVSGLTSAQFKRLFGDSAHNGNDDATLAGVLGVNAHELIPPERTSLIPAYEKISDEMMKKYLSKEFSLYVSQGCKFACDFCAAVRTFRDPATGEVRKVKETYRAPEIISRDLECLINKSKKFGIRELKLYMSNLDVFQTPSELLKFAYAVQDVKQRHPDFGIRLRGLTTADSYLKARNHNRKSIEELVKAGLYTVGFGVDGMTPQVWKAIHKGINTEDKCLEAIRSAREDFGITPEILMVFGHVGADTEETLKLAYEFTLNMVDKYRAVPRPHVAKNFIPGNNGWIDPRNSEAVDSLIKHPESFQALDFTALPSKLTHHDDRIRELASEYYLKICSIPENTTLWVKPITPDLTPEGIRDVKKFNEGRYDR